MRVMNARAKVNGGELEGSGLAAIAGNGTDAGTTVNVTGGTFSSDVSKYYADNYTAVPNADGTYGIETGDVIPALRKI